MITPFSYEMLNISLNFFGGTATFVDSSLDEGKSSSVLRHAAISTAVKSPAEEAVSGGVHWME